MAEITDAGSIGPALARVPCLKDARVSSVTRLGGLTNLNFLVDANGSRYVVRVPGPATSEYINRSYEELAALEASKVGVNAAVLFFDATDGLMVTRFVDNCCTMTEARFKDTGTVARAGQLLWRLHTGCPLFAKDFKLFDMIDEYKSLLEMKGAVLPKGYADMEVIANRARLALSKRSIPMRPCHCDPLCENFLDVKELDDNNAGKMYLIDYEYAGNNDPMWDLGDLSVEGHFSDDQDMELLHAYFSGPPPAEQVARMVIYKGLCDLLWTLWGVIQHSNGNPAEDFWLYAQNRFNRCHSLMSGDRFQQAVQTIERDDFCDTIT